MRPDAIAALETRTDWLRWMTTEHAAAVFAIRAEESLHRRHTIANRQLEWEAYRRALATTDVFAITLPFCRLIEHARTAIPAEMQFDARWLQTRAGWCWLAEPSPLPPVVGAPAAVEVGLRAFAWTPCPPGSTIYRGDGSVYEAVPGDYQLCFFCEPLSRPDWRRGFLPWSYPVLRDGVRLGERIAEFEAISERARAMGAGEYVSDAPTAGHELAWTFTALYLMAQRLTISVHAPLDRHARHRAERERLPVLESIKVVTLRRLEADQRRDPTGDALDWHWQWEVRGHWRNQWYPSEGVHKPAFIEAYIKGPPDKPLKPSAGKLFVATR